MIIILCDDIVGLHSWVPNDNNKPHISETKLELLLT
jgi:hypothetical protein